MKMQSQKLLEKNVIPDALRELYERIAKDLPNFPDDIIKQWIGHYAKSDGWPPSNNYSSPPSGKWYGTLQGKPLSFWRELNWYEKEIDINRIKFDSDFGDMSDRLIIEYTTKNFTSFTIQDGKRRFDGIVLYIIKNGSLPVKPILLYQNNEYEILDGNHRIAAYIFCSSSKYAKRRSKYLEKVEFDPAIIQQTNIVWVGYPNS